LTDENYTILSLLRSYTLDGAPTKDENDDGPARCAVKEKYPFSAAANLTEDSIITDPVEIKKIINEQWKVSEEAAKKIADALIASEAESADPKK
jgi:hypothetical protein